MGLGSSYLSRPVKDKISEDGSNSRVSYGACSMQGWRLKQEDAHTCIVEFDHDTNLFGVYDGHGGFEVAQYTSENFPNFLRNNENYKRGNYREALIEAFLGFDDTIATPEVRAVLKKMVKDDKERMVNADNGKEYGGDESSTLVVGNTSQAGCSSHNHEYDEDFETPESLRADASKPIEEVMASYRVPSINKLIIPVEDSNEGKISESTSETANRCDIPSLINGAMNGNKSKVVDIGGKRSEHISENDIMGETPGTSPKKMRKLALDDLEDSTAIKNFITSDAIAEDDEDDSEDETFQPTDEIQDDTTDGDVSSSVHSDEVLNEDEDKNSEEEFMEDDEREGREIPGIDSGCTAVVALLKGHDLYVANAGDSRCVICKTGQAVDMSKDHKPRVKQEYDRILNAGGKVNDDRIDGCLNLSRAMGDHSYKKNSNLPNTEQKVIALPDIQTIKLEPDVEFIVLACDGIWDSMKSQEVVDFVRPKILENTSLSKICEELFDKCLGNHWLDSGSDNMTCIIIKPCYDEFKTPSVETNAPEKSNLVTNDVSAAGDTLISQLPKNIVTEKSTENGIISDGDLIEKSEILTANGDGQPSDRHASNDSTIAAETTSTSQSRPQKRCADKISADNDYNKRQQTENSNLELS